MSADLDDETDEWVFFSCLACFDGEYCADPHFEYGEPFTPIEERLPEDRRNDAVRWYLLIKTVEEMRERTKMGGTLVWHAIAAGDYDGARHVLGLDPVERVSS